MAVLVKELVSPRDPGRDEVRLLFGLQYGADDSY
jgi:hypothetical protein